MPEQQVSLMDSDPDMAELGRFMKAQAKGRRDHRKDRWKDRDHGRLVNFLSETYNVVLVSHTEYHYSFSIGSVTYDYWPSNNTLRGRRWKSTKRMNVDALIPFIKAAHPASMQS